MVWAVPTLEMQTDLLFSLRLKDIHYPHYSMTPPPPPGWEGWKRVSRVWQKFNSLLPGKSGNLEDSFG